MRVKLIAKVLVICMIISFVLPSLQLPGLTQSANAAVPTPVNLALGKTAAIDSEHTTVWWGAERTIDGDDETFAQAEDDNTSSPWKLTIDLGDSMEINRVTTLTGAPNNQAYATVFHISVSQDGVNWNTVADETAGQPFRKNYDFATVMARYVKIDVTATSNPNYCIREVEIYNIPETVKPVTANLNAGKVMAGSSLELSTATTGAAIYYTLDGSDPKASATSQVYTSPIPLTTPGAIEVQAYAVYPGLADSETSSYQYQIPAPGDNLALGASAEFDIEARWGHPAGLAVDGDDNTFAQTQDDENPYPWKMTIDLGNNMEFDSIRFVPKTEAYAVKFRILVSTDKINWTVAATQTNGSDQPKTYEFLPVIARYVKFDITETSKPNHCIKEIEIYDIPLTVGTIMASPDGGVVQEGTKVTLTSPTKDVAIYYTVDGSDPKTSPTKMPYQSPVTITGDTVLKAYGTLEKMQDSAVSTYTYTINPVVAQVAADPYSRSVKRGTAVTLSTETAGADIYYTTDGTDPEISPTRIRYTAPVIINGPVILTTRAVKEGKQSSEMKTFEYRLTEKDISEVTVLSNGKKVILVGGKPFQTYGVQVRTDLWRREADGTGLSNQQIHDRGVFQWARQLNANVVQIPVYWRDCEPSENSFLWTNVDWAINECKENGLKMELLWMGSDVCGSGWSTIIPDYVINNPDKYQRIIDSNGKVVGEGYANGEGDKISLCREDSDLIQSEGKVITALMAHLNEVDSQNVVIGFQVENEPSIVQHNPSLNMTDRCHCDTCNALYAAGNYIDPMEFSSDSLTKYLNTMASFVKNSKRGMYTRVNFICEYGKVDESIQKMRQNAPYVDFVGVDNYGYTQASNWSKLTGDFSAYGNMPHISEQEGSASDSRQKIIDVLAANGAGADVYRLSRTNVNSDNFVVDSHGEDARPWTQEIRGTFGMLSKAMPLLAVKKNGDNSGIDYFNCEGVTIKDYSQAKTLAGENIEYTTSNYGIGIAIADQNDTILMSSGSGSFTLSGQVPVSCSIGYLDENGNWKGQMKKPVVQNGDGSYTIQMEAYEVVRISSKVEELPVSLVKSAVISNGTLDGKEAGLAIDGDLSTYAQAASNTVTSDMTLDLGAKTNFNSVVVASAPAEEEVLENLALGKRVYSEDANAWWHNLNYAVDGNNVTAAQASDVLNWTFDIDLGNTTGIDRVMMYPDSSNYPKVYEIQASQDGSNWQTVVSQNQGSGGSPVVYDFEPVQARYVRMKVDSMIGGTGYGLREFQVFSKANSTAIGKATAKQYEIQVSDDAQNWTTVAREERNYGLDLKSYQFPTVSARYVRIHVTAINGGNSRYGYIIKDAGVYMNGSSDGNNETPGDSGGQVNNGQNGSSETPEKSAIIRPEVVLQGSAAKAAVTAEDVRKAFLNAKQNRAGNVEAVVEIQEVKGAGKYTLEVPEEVLDGGNGMKLLTVKTPLGTWTLSDNMLKDQKLSKETVVEISIAAAGSSSDKNPAVKSTWTLKATIGGKDLDLENRGLSFQAAMNYQPGENELTSKDNIVVLFIDKNGNTVPVPDGRYDEKSGKLLFRAPQIGTYAAAVVHRSFSDIKESRVQQKIELLASRGVVSGTSGSTFSPEASVKRADFVVMLIKSLGLAAEPGSDFSDVREGAYYYKYVTIARKLGITNGVSPNRFGVQDPIAVQDMLVMINKALKLMENADANVEKTATTSSSYQDGNEVSSYARESVDELIQKDIFRKENFVSPLKYATRGEAADILCNMLEALQQ